MPNSIKEYCNGQFHKVYPNIRDERRAKITEKTRKINPRKSPFLGILGCQWTKQFQVFVFGHGRPAYTRIMCELESVILIMMPFAGCRGNGLGREGGTAVAGALERLTALRMLVLG